MPSGVYAQEKVLKQEEKLIGRLQDLQLDSTMVNVMHRQATLLLEGTSHTCIHIHTQMHAHTCTHTQTHTYSEREREGGREVGIYLWTAQM